MNTRSESISRLGRSTKGLLNIIDTLTAKGVTLISHKEKIDTDTPAGNFMFTVFAALSQLEREQLKQRQREGIEIAKAQGKYTGRKPIEIDWTRFGQLYGEWKSKSITGRDFMRRMGLLANTFYRRVREYEAEHGITEPISVSYSVPKGYAVIVARAMDLCGTVCRCSNRLRASSTLQYCALTKS